MTKKKVGCLSTHGGAGYLPGTFLTIYRYKDEPDKDVRATFECPCGEKGTAIPTGSKTHYYSFMENPIGWLKNEVKLEEPTWGNWMPRKYVYIIKE